MSTVVYKIASTADWADIQAVGGYDGSADDLRDGYIHLSAADQLAGTAAKYFAGRADLMLLDVNLEPYGEAAVWEPSRGGALFPHLYARLSADSIVRVRSLAVTDEGEMVFGDEV